MKTSFSTIALLFFFYQSYAQESADLIGDFGYSLSWYYKIELKLLDSSQFELLHWSDIGSTRTSGQWIRKDSRLILTPTKSLYLDSRKNQWVAKANPKENFAYNDIEVLSKNQLFIETGNQHLHLDRLPTASDGPFKIRFPTASINLLESRDSILVRQITKYLDSWENEHYYEVQLEPYSSLKDLELDEYIGLKRCRSITEYFGKVIGAGKNSFFIKDFDSTEKTDESYVELKIIHRYPK